MKNVRFWRKHRTPSTLFSRCKNRPAGESALSGDIKAVNRGNKRWPEKESQNIIKIIRYFIEEGIILHA